MSEGSLRHITNFFVFWKRKTFQQITCNYLKSQYLTWTLRQSHHGLSFYLPKLEVQINFLRSKKSTYFDIFDGVNLGVIFRRSAKTRGRFIYSNKIILLFWFWQTPASCNPTDPWWLAVVSTWWLLQCANFHDREPA